VTATRPEVVDAPKMSGLFRDPAALTSHIAACRAQGFHVISPADQFSAFAPGFGAQVSELYLSPDAERREVYFDGALMEDGDRAIASLGLHRIAQLAGLSWLPSCRRTDPRTVQFLWEFHVDAAYIGADGTPQIINGTAEVDLRDGSAQIGGWTPRRWQTLARTNARKKGQFSGTSDPDAACSIRGWTLDRVMRARPYGLRISETKSKAAAVRTLGVKPTYTVAELYLPFVIVRFQYLPDMNDPVERQLVLEQRLRGVWALYAHVPPALPAAPIPRVVDALPRPAPVTSAPAPDWTEGIRL